MARRKEGVWASISTMPWIAIARENKSWSAQTVSVSLNALQPIVRHCQGESLSSSNGVPGTAGHGRARRAPQV
jgi:hypothetical protein